MPSLPIGSGGELYGRRGAHYQKTITANEDQTINHIHSRFGLSPNLRFCHVAANAAKTPVIPSTITVTTNVPTWPTFPRRAPINLFSIETDGKKITDHVMSASMILCPIRY